jgi:hypothetical protein
MRSRLGFLFVLLLAARGLGCGGGIESGSTDANERYPQIGGAIELRSNAEPTNTYGSASARFWDKGERGERSTIDGCTILESDTCIGSVPKEDLITTILDGGRIEISGTSPAVGLSYESRTKQYLGFESRTPLWTPGSMLEVRSTGKDTFAAFTTRMAAPTVVTITEPVFDRTLDRDVGIRVAAGSGVTVRWAPGDEAGDVVVEVTAFAGGRSQCTQHSRAECVFARNRGTAIVSARVIEAVGRVGRRPLGSASLGVYTASTAIVGTKEHPIRVVATSLARAGNGTAHTMLRLE